MHVCRNGIQNVLDTLLTDLLVSTVKKKQQKKAHGNQGDENASEEQRL